MNFLDLFWVFFMLSALQPVLRPAHARSDARAQG
jgi:hypothetical protein